LGDDAAILLGREGESVDVGIALANDLGEASRLLTIIIDDMHLAHPTPAVLLAFIQALPENVRLVIASRVDLPFSLARLKVTGRVMEIREDALRFSTDESAQFLHAMGVDVSPAEVQRLNQLVEGWPAGLRMALLSIREDADPSRFLSSFSGTDRALTDFLVSEVLDRLPPELVQFMLETSVLDAFDVALCAAVTGREDARRCLEELSDLHLFLVPLDTSGERFRYHHLFGEFLRARLKAQGPDSVESARFRAADALIARGDLLGALRQATQTGDPQRTAGILLAGSFQILDVADRETSASVARAWLTEFGRQQLLDDPVQVLMFATILLLASSSDETVWWLQQVELEHPHPSPEVEALTKNLWASYHLVKGQADRAIEWGKQAVTAVELVGHRERLVSIAPFVLGRAYLQAGRPDDARAVMAQLILGPPGSAIVNQVRAPALSAYAAACVGDLNESAKTAGAAARTADRLQLSVHEPGRILVSLAMASVATEQNKLEEARPLLDLARLGAEETGRPCFLSLVALEEARWLVAMGDVDGAFGQIDNVRVWFPHRSPSVEAELAVRAARIAVQAADERATMLLSKMPDSPAAFAVLAREALTEGDTRRAVELLDRAGGLTTRRERVEVGVLSALAWLTRDADTALRRLQQALSLAHPEGLVRTIIDVGSGVPRLLAAFPMEPRLNDYVEALIEAAETTIPLGHRVVQTSLVDPLTDRELVILRYLSGRLTYKEIAALLYISVNTLKSHVRAVYRKLNVDSRSSAVRTGRSLRLL
jgi:LuxR family maltose regulon positive regulatory protein